MSDKRNDEDALSRYWNALVRGEQHASEVDLRPEDLEVVHRLQRAGTTRFAGASAEDAWPRVLARIEVSRTWRVDDRIVVNSASAVAPSRVPNGRVRGEIVPLFRSSPWGWGQVATAALMLVSLTVSAVAFGLMRQGRFERTEALPAVIASPAAETAAETLFTTVLQNEEIPTIEPTGLVIWNLRIDPGTREPIASVMRRAAAGIQITYVVDGVLTLTVDGPLRVHRGATGGDATSIEQIAPGTEITLHPGDAALYDSERPIEFANLGPNPVQVVSSGYLAGTIAWLPSYDDRFTFLDTTNVYPIKPPLRGPVEATLERISIAPGESTARLPKGSVIAQVGADEDVSIGENSDGSLRNINGRSVSIYAVILTPLGADAEVPATQPPRDAAAQ